MCYFFFSFLFEVFASEPSRRLSWLAFRDFSPHKFRYRTLNYSDSVKQTSEKYIVYGLNGEMGCDERNGKDFTPSASDVLPVIIHSLLKLLISTLKIWAASFRETSTAVLTQAHLRLYISVSKQNNSVNLTNTVHISLFNEFGKIAAICCGICGDRQTRVA